MTDSPALSLNNQTTTIALPLDPLTASLATNQPLTLNHQSNSATCFVDQVLVSPNSQHLILQTFCHADYDARLVQTTDPNADTITFPRGYFLNWSPDGGWFLFRNADNHYPGIARHPAWLVSHNK